MKQKYESLAEAKRQEYKSKMDHYVAPPPGFQGFEVIARKKPALKGDGRPKRAMSSYLLYCAPPSCARPPFQPPL